MSVEKHFSKDLWDKYEFHQWKHACAILKSDFPNEWKDLISMLENFQLLKSWIIKGGGNKTELAKWIDHFLGKRGWIEKQFSTSVIVDENKMDSPTHKIDCYKNRIALELEWNNKGYYSGTPPHNGLGKEYLRYHMLTSRTSAALSNKCNL